VYIYPKETGLSDVVSNMVQNILFCILLCKKKKQVWNDSLCLFSNLV